MLIFRFNNQILSIDHATINTYYGGTVSYSAYRSGLPERIDTYYWFHFSLPLDLVIQGENALEVMMEEILVSRTEDRTLQQVELTVSYVEPPVPVQGQM